MIIDNTMLQRIRIAMSAFGKLMLRPCEKDFAAQVSLAVFGVVARSIFYTSLTMNANQMEMMMQMQRTIQQMQMAMLAPPVGVVASEGSRNNKREREEMAEDEGELDSTPRTKARSTGRARRAISLKPDTVISSSITYIFQLPLARSQEIIEKIHEDFDSVITGTPEWTVGPLMRLLWLLTEVQPNQSISSTRCIHYCELMDKLCSQATRRQEQLSQHRYQQLILSLTPLTVAKVNHAAEHLGFCDSWLTKPKPVPKGKANARQLALLPPGPPTPTPALANGDPHPTPNRPTVARMLKSTPSANDFSAPSMVLPPIAPVAPPAISTASEAVAPPLAPDVAPPAMFTASAAVSPALAPVAPPVMSTASEAVAPPFALVAPPVMSTASEAVAPVTAPPRPFAASTSPSEEIAPITPTPAARADDEASRDNANLLEIVARKREAALLRRQAREAAAESRFVEHAEALPDAASPAAAAEPVVDDDGRECIICKSPMKGGEEVQALECMHVFHRECVDEYMRVGGQSFRYACPYKCFHSELQPEAETVVVAVNDDTQPAVVPDEALLDAADSMTA